MKYSIITVTISRLIKLIVLILSISSASFATETDRKTDSNDSRIKTFIYSENEIYRVVVYNGFQTNVEFANGEYVQTLSLGDTYAWKITPVERRLFIRPLEENIHTNMTVITNRRTYQFEILSQAPADIVNDNFAYVVRFFYPGSNS